MILASLVHEVVNTEVEEIAGAVVAFAGAAGYYALTRQLRRKRNSRRTKVESELTVAKRPGRGRVPPDVDRFTFRERVRDIPRSVRHAVKQERYANVEAISSEGDPIRTIYADDPFYLRVDIGALARESLVEEPVPVPEEVLPTEDIVLTVLLSSNDFGVGYDFKDCKRGHAVEHRLRLPADGGSAVADDGHKFVEFALRAPRDELRARARLSYLYRNAVLQSQRLDAEFGEPLRVVTDFTLSTQLGGDVDTISERPRVTVIANDSPGERHELTIRSGDASGAPIGNPVTFPIEGDRIGPTVAELRGALERRAPRRRQQRRRDLVETLRLIAPLGWKLWTALEPQLRRAVRDAARSMPDAVLHIALAEGSTFTLPWSFVYDIFLEEDAHPGDLLICPLVTEWDEHSPMVDPNVRACPHAGPDGHEEGTLCPFGFWGYRYKIEILTPTETPATSIRCSSGASAVVGVTHVGIRRKQMENHIKTLAETFHNGAGLKLRETATKKELRRLIERDIPILYFLCHGKRRQNITVLSIGRDDRVPPGDLMGWMQVASMRGRDPMWSNPQPLVFINACGSTKITPQDLVDYLGAFVRSGNAAGLIGTEVKIERTQAMELAQEFFAELFEPDACVDNALHHVRMSFLADGNLFGLVYTPYCFADLAMVKDGDRSSAAVELLSEPKV
jgi:hypothetical protein